jgi:hypothetical protein
MDDSRSSGGLGASLSGRRYRRGAALALAATASLGLIGAGLAPAMASTPPSMTANHGSVNIAIQGPKNSLKFYWAVNGTPTWHAETVAGANTTYTATAMTVNGN